SVPRCTAACRRTARHAQQFGRTCPSRKHHGARTQPCAEGTGDRGRQRNDSRVTMFTLVVRNLLRRPARTLLTALGVALGVGLIVALLSISTGVQRTAGDLIHLGHADFGLFQADVSDFSRSLLPESLAAKVRDEPGVAETARLKLVASSGPKSFFIFGLDPHEFVWHRLVLLHGRFPRTGEALVGDKLGLRV